jgi:hypothetical protein
MKKALVVFFLLIWAGLFLSAAANKKQICVAVGETYAKNINAFQQDLEIKGRVNGSVFLVGGTLLLEGVVMGDAICLGAQVNIKAGAVIQRDLIVIGGHLNKAEQCKINGDVYYVRSKEDLRQITRSIIPFLPESGGQTFLRISKIFFWFILVMLALLVMPVKINQAADMLGKTPLRYGAIGLLALLIFILLLLSFIIMSLVLIGIPLLIILMLAYFLVLVFGRTVVFYCFGSKLSSALKLKGNAVFFVVLGATVYALVKFIPWLGVPLLIAMDIFAIGIGVGFCLRKKSA